MSNGITDQSIATDELWPPSKTSVQSSCPHANSTDSALDEFLVNSAWEVWLSWSLTLRLLIIAVYERPQEPSKYGLMPRPWDERRVGQLRDQQTSFCVRYRVTHLSTCRPPHDVFADKEANTLCKPGVSYNSNPTALTSPHCALAHVRGSKAAGRPSGCPTAATEPLLVPHPQRQHRCNTPKWYVTASTAILDYQAHPPLCACACAPYTCRC